MAKFLRQRELNMTAGLGMVFPWQVDAIRLCWEKLLEDPADRNAVRHMRVMLRRLRSCLTFFKPALVPLECAGYTEVLRRQGELLSALREADVLFIKLCRMETETGKKCPRLRALTEAYRAEETERLRENIANRLVLKQLDELDGWISKGALTGVYLNAPLNEFLSHRLWSWQYNILGLRERYRDFADMESAHKIRIKVKRLRYVLMSLPELGEGAGPMLKKLKVLQDALGLLHDDYVNGLLARELADKEDAELAAEIGSFTAWSGQKVRETLTGLPLLWDEFCGEFSSWIAARK